MNVPIHPALVHVPLGIAIVLPLIAIGLAIAVWRNKAPAGVWGVVVGLQAVLVAAAFAALKTGSADGERLDHLLGERAIERHEDAAELFLGVAAASLAIGIATLLLRSAAARRAGIAATTAAALLTAGLAVNTGKRGGELVYVHNAASFYAQGASPSATPAQGGERRGREGVHEHDGDDDD